MTIHLENNLICYGATLARPMTPTDAAAILSRIDHDRELGCGHVIVARGTVPGALDVHYLADRLAPEQSIAVLATALSRLMKLHGRPKTAPVIIDQVDAQVIRMQAENIVDFIRAGRFVDKGGQQALRFDNAREVCVRMLVIAMATVAVTPSALANGISNGAVR